MQDINEKFKDVHPAKTVERIQSILKSIGIELEESWNDSGIENCCSLMVHVKDTFGISSNGKGVTKELARASAYGEFIERLQCGLFFYKFQSITRDPAMNLHSFAPDGKIMSMQELEKNGEWMDYIIQEYGSGLTRKKLAKQAWVYACTDEDKILTLPFYSLFEDKYVYLPAGFVEHMYSANGCCVGNTREEAWVHALSEIMERRSSTTTLTGGKSLPPIPDEVVNRFPTAVKILDKIRESGQYDVQIFDASLGSGFPVVATRIINKKSHGYHVNFAADPILEIAIDRSLTESFQGRSIFNYGSYHNGSVQEEAPKLSAAHNVLNQLETGNGIFAMDFLTEEASCDTPCSQFPDHTNKNNEELLNYMLGLFRKLNRPVYVRNYSFLGFNCYKFVVPGFSESRGMRLTEPVPEFALGDAVVSTLRNAAGASDADLNMLLVYHKKISAVFSRRNNFSGLAGLPLSNSCNSLLLGVTLSYAAYRLGLYPQAMEYLDTLIKNGSIDAQIRAYFSCVQRYLRLRSAQVPEEKIRIFLTKCYEAESVKRLYDCLDRGATPYDDFLMSCDCVSCANCRYQDACSYTRIKEIIGSAGKVYQTFADGQRKEEFAV